MGLKRAAVFKQNKLPRTADAVGRRISAGACALPGHAGGVDVITYVISGCSGVARFTQLTLSTCRATQPVSSHSISHTHTHTHTYTTVLGDGDCMVIEPSQLPQFECGTVYPNVLSRLHHFLFFCSRLKSHFFIFVTHNLCSVPEVENRGTK